MIIHNFIAIESEVKLSLSLVVLRKKQNKHTTKMAPDADTLRQRKPLDVAGDDDVATEPTDKITTMKSLGGNEVVIDGIIYDISDFDHPGGEQIKMFGGNDVTIQYKMIHPYHTSKHLEKMNRVGKAADYATE